MAGLPVVLLLAAVAATASPAPTRKDAVGDVYRFRSEARYAERNVSLSAPDSRPSSS